MADVRRPRARKKWGEIGTNVINAISADGTFITGTGLSGSDPFTVLRMIGEFMFGPGAVNVIDDVAAISFGIGVFSNDAFTLGGTAMPDPEAEPNFPWLFWSTHIFHQTIAQADATADPRMALRRSFDVRSMRKIKPREILGQVIQYRDINGAPTVDIVFGKTRVLQAVA